MQESWENEEKKSPYTEIIQQIRKMIQTGQLMVGDRLPSERKLAEILNVSRGNLRQALQALAERNIIESRQGDGTYLIGSWESLAAEDVIVEALYQQGGMIRDILEIRQILEPHIASLAARRMKPAQLDQLKIIVCDQQRALLSGRADEGFDAAFHQLVTQCSCNKVLLQVMETIQSILDQTRSNWLQSKERRQDSITGHLLIIEALEQGDTEAAFRAMKQHIIQVEEHILGEQEE